MSATAASPPESDEGALLLCRWNLPPIHVVSGSSVEPLEALELEKRLQCHASEVCIVPCPDMSWLRCPRPSSSSILGLEDWWETSTSSSSSLPLLQTRIYRDGGGDDHAEASCCCSALPPHELWTLAHWKNPDKSHSGGMKDSSRVHQISWLDLRYTATTASPTLAVVTHFMRSLLGTSHSSSPWIEAAKDANEPDVVVLLVDTASMDFSEMLSRYRVSDAAPSWFLHSKTVLEDFPMDDSIFSLNYTPAVSTSSTTTSSTLFVYKRLPPRPTMTQCHPQDETLRAPNGCLWETYYVYENEEDSENEDRIEDVDPTQPVEMYRVVAPPYQDHNELFPNLMQPLLENIATMRQEAISIPQWTAWPEKQHYSSQDGGESWTVFPLCYCFPANDVSRRQFVPATCAYVPQTVKLLQTVLGDTLRTALFSRLQPNTTLSEHTGWQDLANHVLRIHIPLVVPPGGLCGTWVDGCVETHQEDGHIVCFDDSKIHRAFNYSSQERIVLILDLARPSFLPLGTAVGGHSEELDKFIAQMS